MWKRKNMKKQFKKTILSLILTVLATCSAYYRRMEIHGEDRLLLSSIRRKVLILAAVFSCVPLSNVKSALAEDLPSIRLILKFLNLLPAQILLTRVPLRL